MTYGTTTYTPPEGQDRYAATDPMTASAPCAGCGRHQWDHQLVEDHQSPYAGPLTYAVEASDDNGRTYTANGLRWAAAEDAERWAGGLALRWFGCTHIRVVRCTADGTPTGEVVHQTL